MDKQSAKRIFEGGEIVRECIVCKEFERTSKFLGICGETGEKTGINNGCVNCKLDMAKVESIAIEATRIYYESNVTPAEALKRAKEKYE